MLIIYFSQTGNVARFITKLNQNYFKVIRGTENLQADEEFILITPTTGYGQVPFDVELFCSNNCRYLKYVIASGNRNWGTLFANSGAILAHQYHVPLLYKFELSGTTADVTHVNKLLKKIYQGEQCTQQ